MRSTSANNDENKMTSKINLILHSEAYVNIYLSYDGIYFYCLRNAISAVFDAMFHYCILSGLILHFVESKSESEKERWIKGNVTQQI